MNVNPPNAFEFGGVCVLFRKTCNINFFFRWYICLSLIQHPGMIYHPRLTYDQSQFFEGLAKWYRQGTILSGGGLLATLFFDGPGLIWKKTHGYFFLRREKNLRFHTVHSGWLWMESGFTLISLSLVKPYICVPLIRPNFFGLSYPTNHLSVAPYDANQPPG